MSEHAAHQVGTVEKVAYGLGDLSSNLIWIMLVTYIMYFYTDVYGISAAAAGTMIMVVRIWDALINPVFGLICDRTRSRWGQFRPYMLFGGLPLAVAGVLAFTTPDLSEHYKLIYAYISYILLMTIYSAVNVPYSALLGVMSPDNTVRENISTYRFLLAFVGVIFVQYCTLDLVVLLGDTPQSGFRNTMVLYGVIATMLMLVSFSFTRERIEPSSIKKSSIREDLVDLLTNKPWLVLCLVSIITNIYYAIRTGTTLYYFKYYVGDETQASVFLAGGSLFLTFGIMSTKFLTRRFDKVKLFSALLFLDGIFIASMYLAQPDDLYLINGLHFISLFFIGPVNVMLWSMYSDAAVFSEWKTGRRANGLVISASVFTNKFGVAVGGALVGMVLAYSGFEANLMQSGAALENIRILMSLVPGALSIGAATIITLYALDKKKMATIEKHLERKRIQFKKNQSSSFA